MRTGLTALGMGILMLALGAPSLFAQCEGQGNASLLMKGQCNIGSSVKFRLAGSPRQKFKLLRDSGDGPTELPGIGTLCLDLGPDRTNIFSGRFNNRGVASVRTDLPDDPGLIGSTVAFQFGATDPEAPNGVAISNGYSFTLCDDEMGGDVCVQENCGLSTVSFILPLLTTEAFPATVRLAVVDAGDETNVLGEIEVEFDPANPLGPVQSSNNALSLSKLTYHEAIGALIFHGTLNTSTFSERRFPGATRFISSVGNDETAVDFDTECGTPIQTGTKFAPLFVSGVEICVPAEIGDFVYCDINENGIQDDGEPGVPGITVNLVCVGPDGQLGTDDDFVASTTTNENGQYLFEDVVPGQCFVDLDIDSIPEDKFVGECPPMVPVDLGPGESFLDADFCLIERFNGVCLVIIDEDTIDNGISTIQQAAADNNTLPDVLVNDDRPTEVGNPPLVWNELYAGDVVLLPAGQVDDEGLFALPENTPWSVEDYAAGKVPQDQLDKIDDVMPIRNQDLYRMIGLTCTAVVYDSDISMNFVPIQGNLQGARYGLFTFTVLDVQVAGTLEESGSSTSLYELLVRVEEPAFPTFSYQVEVFDHEPDSIQITTADYDASTETLTVEGTSNFGSDAVMTFSVQDFVFEAPMTYNSNTGRHEATVNTSEDLTGRRISIQTDRGGAYRINVN